MARRASVSGAIYVALPEQKGLHTSEYLNKEKVSKKTYHPLDPMECSRNGMNSD